MTLIEKIKQKEITVGILGLGYVGLPLLCAFSKAGLKVIGFDVDGPKVDGLNQGKSYIEHIPHESIANAKANGFEATTDMARSSEADALIICVPTPLNLYREPDLSFVNSTMDAILPHLREGQILSLESTTYPGTTEEVLRPKLEERGLKVGDDFFLIYSPEREDPGRKNFTTKTIPKICGGSTSKCLELGLSLYELIVDKVVAVSSTKVAEMTKLLENIHRAVNIGLVNEMKVVADKMGIDIHEVIEAAATKPFGFVPYSPGPGLGGHCIPIDPFYLTWKAREFGLHTRFIELAGEINSSMPHYVIDKTANALNERGKSLKNSKFLILGIAYKRNVDDMRESPAVEIMEILKEKGGHIEYCDPHVKTFPKMRKHSFELSSVDISDGKVKNYDCIILTTDHECFDFENIREEASLIIDTRGVYQGQHSNVVKA